MSAMRARLTMKLVSLAVMVVITIIGARSGLGGGSSSSPLTPQNVENNGVAALCANQQATADAGGGPPVTSFSLPSLPGLPGGTFACPPAGSAPAAGG